ncbi:uncharacterized protein [Oryza sativa Japonica Group]|uniref:uncharacterized protein n=1 Tax=Oryza sativa subsp. japonica TaxID=39947 RepID=UPI00339C69E6
MAHVLISQLSCGDLNTRILARVSRLWDFCDLNGSGNIFHTDLVLLDQMGNSIHAQIYPPAIDSLRPLLKEQKVYYIDSFTVRYANRTYRPVDNSLMIVFSKWTTFEEYIEPAADFPGITFSLTPFSDIPNLVDKTIFYVDVMGVITEVGSPTVVRPKSRNADSLKRTIQICDASNSTMPVTLWGERADAFDANSVYNAGQTQAQVIVFVGTLVKDYTGLGLTVTGSSPCKWYLNLDIPEVLELKERYKVVLIAGDASSNATFILFGRVAHRLIKKSVESLIEDNPPDSDYIPAEIAALVDSTFTWNVSFTRTISYCIRKLQQFCPNRAPAKPNKL